MKGILMLVSHSLTAFKNDKRAEEKAIMNESMAQILLPHAEQLPF